MLSLPARFALNAELAKFHATHYTWGRNRHGMLSEPVTLLRQNKEADCPTAATYAGDRHLERCRECPAQWMATFAFLVAVAATTATCSAILVVKAQSEFADLSSLICAAGCSHFSPKLQ